VKHWRSYGTDPLPSPVEALAEPLRALAVDPPAEPKARRK
jgi:hypothetical protein